MYWSSVAKVFLVGLFWVAITVCLGYLAMRIIFNFILFLAIKFDEGKSIKSKKLGIFLPISEVDDYLNSKEISLPSAIEIFIGLTEIFSGLSIIVLVLLFSYNTLPFSIALSPNLFNTVDRYVCRYNDNADLFTSKFIGSVEVAQVCKELSLENSYDLVTVSSKSIPFNKLIYYPFRGSDVDNVFDMEYSIKPNTEVLELSGELKSVVKSGKDSIKIGDYYLSTASLNSFEKTFGICKSANKIKIVYSKNSVKGGIIEDYKILDFE